MIASDRHGQPPVVLDYGVGNVGSLVNLAKACGVRLRRISDPALLGDARCIILPGVGAFDHVMGELQRSGFASAVSEVLQTVDPPHFLGVCVGMQVLFEGSEEGQLPGLGLIPGRVVRFKSGTLPIPHMAWSDVEVVRLQSVLDGFDTTPRFYFVHSYHPVCDDPGDVVGTCEYGITFPAVVQRGNVVACQFHPEKSHRFGKRLFEQFFTMSGVLEGSGSDS